MQVANWLPWNWGKHEVDVHREEGDRVHTLQTDINRAFDSFWRSFNSPFFPVTANGVFGDGMPRMEVGESDKEVEISVELPGMSEEDIDVTLSNDVLTVRGERKEHREEKRKDYHVREWNYGSLQRSVPLPSGLDLDQVKAHFKNGVLTVTLPKTEEAKNRVKRITVN